MKYYTKTYLKSEQFYSNYYMPDISLRDYILRENFFRKLGTFEVATEIINLEFINDCQEYFKQDIMFFDDLSKYIIDFNGEILPLTEYTFFKLQFYSTKFLLVVNEARNFFEDEWMRFENDNYDKALLELNNCYTHDAKADFEFANNILRIHFRQGSWTNIFEFSGIDNWQDKKFMKVRPSLVLDELYEESKDVFVYNTLWSHAEIEGENHSEISIKFTSLKKIK